MRIEIGQIGIYKILRIQEHAPVLSQLDELRSLVNGYLSRDDRYMAVCFTGTSYLYSGAIAVLISCYKMVRDKGGDLCILEPKPELLNLLHQMGIDTLINIYQSESDLPDDPRQIEVDRINFPD